MNFRQIIRYLSDQLDAALDAPVPIAIGIVVAALIVWRLVEWRYGRVIARLRNSVERKQNMLRVMKEGVPRPASGEDDDGSRPEPATGPTEAMRDRQKALRKIVNAIDAAQMARQSGDPREIEKAMPALGLGLLTARNAFDVRVPSPSGAAAADLETGRQLLELIRPALLLGHDEEARELAERFLTRAAAA